MYRVQQSMLIALGVMSVVGLNALTANAYVIVTDTFSLGITRPEGTTLAGLTTEDSSGTWKTAKSTNGSLTAAGTVITTSITVPLEARVAVAPPGAMTEIKASALFTDSNWFGVAFTSSDTDAGASGWFEAAESLLWASIRPNGKWDIYVGGSNSIQHGTISGFDSSLIHTIALQYDPVANAASLKIDDVNVNSGWTTVNVTASNIGAAAFRLHLTSTAGQTGANSFVDRFEVSVNPVPETATLSLLACGGGLLLSRRKH